MTIDFTAKELHILRAMNNANIARMQQALPTLHPIISCQLIFELERNLELCKSIQIKIAALAKSLN